MGLLCNSSADGGRMIAWLLGGLWNRIFSFSPTVTLLSSCGLFVTKGRCGTKEHEQWLSEYFKTQLLLKVQRSDSFSQTIQLHKKKGFTFFFPTSLYNVLLPSPLPSCLVSFFWFFCLRAWFCSQSRPMLGSCLGPGHSGCFAAPQQVNPQKPTQTFSLGWVVLILSHITLHLPPHTQTHTHRLQGSQFFFCHN